jgi:hypothetical protein
MNISYTGYLNFNKTTTTNKTQFFISTSLIRSWDIWEYCLLILLIFALIGNTLTILVMRSKRMQTTNTSLLLTSLAVADIIVLTLKFLINMQKLYKIPVYGFCIIIYILPDIAALTSYWLIITTTTERSIAVWFPLKVSTIITKKRCYGLILILISLFTMMGCTQIVCLQPIPATPHYCGIKGVITGKCRYYIRYIYPWIKSAIMSWIPSMMGIVLNTLIIISLAKAGKKRKTMTNDYERKSVKMVSVDYSSDCSFIKPNVERLQSIVSVNNFKKMPLLRRVGQTFQSQSSKERQITVMLCTVSITFVLFTLPYAIYELLRKLNPNSLAFQNRFIHRAVLFFIDCLHATNFILYCLTGKKFRDELRNILKCKK